MRDQELQEALSEIIFQLHQTSIDDNQRGTIYEVIIGCFNNEGLLPNRLEELKGLDPAFDEVWEEMFGDDLYESLAEEREDEE